MKQLLFLDDRRVPTDCISYMGVRGVNPAIYSEEWIIVRSYGEFVRWVTNNGMPDFISFDHDLGDVPELKASIDFEDWYSVGEERELTGMDCAKWLVEYCMDYNHRLPDFAVHSDNPGGRENISGLLKSFKKSG